MSSERRVPEGDTASPPCGSRDVSSVGLLLQLPHHASSIPAWGQLPRMRAADPSTGPARALQAHPALPLGARSWLRKSLLKLGSLGRKSRSYACRPRWESTTGHGTLLGHDELQAYRFPRAFRSTPAVVLRVFRSRHRQRVG